MQVRLPRFFIFSSFLAIIALSFFSPSSVEACDDSGLPTAITNCSESTYCSGGTFWCTNPNNPSTCTQQVYDRVVDFENPATGEHCSSTVFFKNEQACEDITITQQADPYCKAATCNPDLAAQYPNDYQNTGPCGGSWNFCTGGYSTQCPGNYGTTGPGIWCEGWNCGFQCEVDNWQCLPNPWAVGNTTGVTYNGGPGNNYGFNNCSAACAPGPTPTPTSTPTPTPTATPTPTPTASPGEWIPTLCTNGHFSGCRLQGNPDCTDYGNASYPNWNNNEWSQCNTACNLQNRDSFCSGPSPNSYSVSCAGNNVSVNVNSGNGCSGCINGHDDTTGGWAFLGANAPSTNAVSGNHSISVSATNGVSVSGSPISCGGGGGGGGGQGGGGGGSGCGACNAAEPACGSVSWGTCSNNPSQSCSRPGTACEGSGQVRIRFFNADCTTLYNQAGIVNLLEDDRDDQQRHNDLFYPLYKAEAQGWQCTDNEGVPYPGENAPNIDDDKCESGHYSSGVGPCDFAPWHPYKDPGYQINGDGTLGGCPSENMDGGWFDEEICDDEGNNCYKEWKHSGNDTCINTEDDPPSTFPRCFQPQTSQHIKIQAGASTRFFTFDGTYDEIRSRTFTFSAGAPTGYKLKVRAMCQGGNDAACAAYFSGETGQGTVVKEFDAPIAGYTNYWASPIESVNSNAFVLAYDICVKGTTLRFGGHVYLDPNCNGSTSGYGGAQVALDGVGTTTTDGAGYYAFNDLEPGTYTAHVSVPVGYRACGSTSQTVSVNSDNDNAANFSIAPVAPPWFQTKDADLFSLGSIVSRIPQQCINSCTPYLSLAGDGGFPGVPVYTSTFSTGYGSVSQKGWVANAITSTKTYNYASFAALMPTSGVTTVGTSINGSEIESAASSTGVGWLYSDGNLTVNGNTNLQNKKAVLFVNGNLTLNGTINLTKGSGFFAVFVKGTITIDPSVTGSPALEGIYFADGTISTGTRGSPNADSQLKVRGVLSSLSTVNLQRDLDPTLTTGGNNETPAESIEYAPDLILLFPSELLVENTIWEEVAP